MVVFSKLRNALAKKGVFVSKVTADKDLADFFRFVRPVAVDKELVRIGGDNDGGYLTPNDLDGVEACFSPGVSDVATFEEALSAKGVKSFLADYSVECAPVQSEMISFEKKFLGSRDDGIHMRLESWVHKHAADIAGDLILQMDIEGAEYEVVLDTSRDVMQRFRILLIEFHGMERLFEQEGFRFIRQVFRKLLDDYYVCHIHPNNADPVWKNGPFVVPRTLEFTFLRRDRAAPTGQALSFPHPLDMANMTDRKDIPLPPCWHRDIEVAERFAG